MISKRWFTLIELIISMTIWAIILLSVISIFISASDISNKIDISRAMQENTKNIVEEIAEDIRQNWIKICSVWEVNCHTIIGSDNYVNVTKLYVWSNRYFLARKADTGDFVEVSDMTVCQSVTSECVFVKNADPLSNSFVTFTDIQFTITNASTPKVTINFTMKPSWKKWIKPKLIEESELTFQTTITERIIKSN